MAMPLAAAPYRASGLDHWYFSDMQQSLTMSASVGRTDSHLSRATSVFDPGGVKTRKIETQRELHSFSSLSEVNALATLRAKTVFDE